jgi:hypothetical protein
MWTWFNIFLGLWLFLSGIPGMTIPAYPVVFGVLFFLLGLLYRKWPGYIVALLGIWTFISAYFNILDTPLMFLSIGLLVTLFTIVQMAVE